jgi:hypothetical protein
MKKLLTIALLGAAASLSYGQGSVNFSAGALPSTRIWTNQVQGGPSTGQINGAGSYYFALFVAPTTTGTNYSLSSSLDPTGAGFTLVNSPIGAYGTNTVLGRMNGNPTTDGTIVAGYGISSQGNFVVVGWSANIAGPDWNAFRAWSQGGSTPGWAGHSSVAENVTLGGGLIPQGTIFGGGAGQASGFGLGFTQVPEPSTFALAGLGAAALVIFRRRKA